MYLDKIVIVVITNSLEINCKTLILKTKYKGFFMFRSKGVVIGFWLIPDQSVTLSDVACFLNPAGALKS